MNKYAVMTSLFSAIGGAIAGGTIAILVTRKHYIEYADVEIEKELKAKELVEICNDRDA